MTKLERLREACQKVTPGPWAHAHISDGVEPVHGGKDFKYNVANANRCADGEFISLCDPQTVLALLDAVEALQRMPELIRKLSPGRAWPDENHAVAVLARLTALEKAP